MLTMRAASDVFMQGAFTPQAGPVTLKRAAQKLAHTLIECRAQRDDLALGPTVLTLTEI